MSGHSKWHKIKRAKGEQDKKRGKIFTRCLHEIAVAVKEGKSGDPDSNPRLRIAVDKAKSNNMPNDNIERAIKRALGGEKDVEKFESTYEGYGPGGTALFVEVLTDNKNRTVGEVRHAFTKCGGSLGENGCVGWMFTRKGVFLIPKAQATEEQIYDVALEAGAGDIEDADDMWEITCEVADFANIQKALSQKFTFEEAELQMVPSNRVEVSGKEAEQIARLVEMLEDLDDVMAVYTNGDFVG
ncbi:MAG: YebC/PmpR family DNA-binding transcriptional regulator [Deltaproteobacteria bacterium]|jgi:YebC/PmpR family DNA-binding regulatory protein|nr:YebC/PmpR family DNA-binding transcriptional regulator [Deltaproteobacteria bacterium]